MIGGAPAGAPFSIYMGERMPKPFMTYEQQIQKLRDKNQYVVRRDFIAVVLAFRYLLPVISNFPMITYLVFWDFHRTGKRLLPTERYKLILSFYI